MPCPYFTRPDGRQFANLGLSTGGDGVPLISLTLNRPLDISLLFNMPHDRVVPGFRESVLDQFEPDVAVQLIEFGKYLATINADFLVFMARKSLCLYDVLVRIGVPPIERCLLSDRVLDLDLAHFKGRKIALIDDTLIAGTTLAKAKQTLLRAGAATVTVHVFCVDLKYWSRELITPDTCRMYLEDPRVMTFCAAAVRALSLMPRPYLVDFPLSKPIKIPAGEAQCFLSNRAWRGFNISTSLQERHDVSSLSFFPNATARADLERRWGSGLSEVLDIIKVRGFARKLRDVYWLQIVPIAVLKPMRVADLERLSLDVLRRVPGILPEDIDGFMLQTSSPRAKQRLSQYILSCIVGRSFLSESGSSITSDVTVIYDQNEAERHYGPWLSRPLQAINRARTLGRAATASYSAAAIPGDVLQWAKKSIDDAQGDDGQTPMQAWFDRDNHEIRNLIPAFTDLFIRHYDAWEIPARLDAKRRGAEILDTIETSGRDRLERGLPWSAIVDHILSVHRLQRSPELENALSLVLDFCNDQGIAVPVTWVTNDIVIRAYRHGEDVKYTDAEPALAYHAIRGYLKATRLESIPRLRLEKLLVILMKVGVARRFMQPLFLTATGVQEVLRIGFYLHGAIPMLQRGPKDRADRDMWFSDHLKVKGVLIESETGQYKLGKEVEGNFVDSGAPVDAYELGHIIGKLSTPQGGDGPPLDSRSLTLLASCGTPRHAAAAVQVELDIFRRWYEDEARTLMISVEWESQVSIDDALSQLVTGKGHYAVHEARLKYLGYAAGEPQRIVERCCLYLDEHGEDLLSAKWNAYWKSTGILESAGEKEIFDPELAQAMLLCWEAAACLSAFEICLAARAAVLRETPDAGEKVVKACHKLERYTNGLLEIGLEAPRLVKQLGERFKRVEEAPEADWDNISGVDFAAKAIDQRLPAIGRQIELMNPLIEEYGRLYGRRDYQYMVYYDIIDSTATIAGASGTDVPAYRSRVHTVKTILSRNFDQLAQDARKRASEVFCWNGAATSTNDCKHVFIGGTDAFLFLEEALKSLVASLRSSPGQRFRIYLVPCGFVGSSAYRTEWDTEISGERFWEHWSRLAKAGKQFEDQLPRDLSFLLVATDSLISRLHIPPDVEWDSPTDSSVKTEIEMLGRETKVRWGSVRPRRVGPSKPRPRGAAR
jgi:hypothetical protein